MNSTTPVPYVCAKCGGSIYGMQTVFINEKPYHPTCAEMRNTNFSNSSLFEEAKDALKYIRTRGRFIEITNTKWRGPNKPDMTDIKAMLMLARAYGFTFDFEDG